MDTSGIKLVVAESAELPSLAPAPAPSALAPSGDAAALSIAALLDESVARAETVAQAQLELVKTQESSAESLSASIAAELADLEREQARLATTTAEVEETWARVEREAAARAAELVAAGRAEEQLALGRAQVADGSGVHLVNFSGHARRTRLAHSLRLPRAESPCRQVQDSCGGGACVPSGARLNRTLVGSKLVATWWLLGGYLVRVAVLTVGVGDRWTCGGE